MSKFVLPLHDSQKKIIIPFLIFLPFVLSQFERSVLKPLTFLLPVPDTSRYLLKICAVSLLVLAFAAYRGQSYGLEITKKTGKAISLLIVGLLCCGFFFLFSLQSKLFFDSFAVLHLVNWALSVFREEFVLRGIIQTEASYLFSGKFLNISHSIWISTISFSLWHLVNLVVWPWQVVAIQMIQCIPSGIILGLIREKTGNTLVTYLLHICGDLLFLSLYMLLTGKLFASMF